jgi:hypothetical protein
MGSQVAHHFSSRCSPQEPSSARLGNLGIVFAHDRHFSRQRAPKSVKGESSVSRGRGQSMSVHGNMTTPAGRADMHVDEDDVPNRGDTSIPMQLH